MIEHEPGIHRFWSRCRRSPMAQSRIAFLIAACNCLAATAEVNAEEPYRIAWADQVGTRFFDQFTGVTADSAFGAYVSGIIYDVSDDPSPGGFDCLVARYSHTGELLWSRQFGTPELDQALGVSNDLQGGVYVTGRTAGALDSPNSGGDDAFLRKYDSNGLLQWTRQLGTAGRDVAEGVASGPFGGVVIAGHTEGRLGTQSAGNVDAFIAQYDGDGGLTWIQQFGSDGIDRINGIATNQYGDVFVAGRTQGSLDGGPQEVGYDAFLAKFDSLGSLQWLRQIGDSTSDTATAVAVDMEGNVLVAGQTPRLTTPVDGEVYLRKYSGDGNLLWSRQFGSQADDGGTSVSVDASGAAYLTGWTRGAIAGPNEGSSDIFVSKYDTSGNFLWATQFGTGSSDEGLGIAAGDFTGVFVAGNVQGMFLEQGAGGVDAILVHLVPEPSSICLSIVGLAFLACLGNPLSKRSTKRS